jgi:hypothetical protein
MEWWGWMLLGFVIGVAAGGRFVAWLFNVTRPPW